MLKIKSIKRYIRQILALIEKNIYLEFRIKTRIFYRYLNPIIQLVILVFIFGTIFNIKEGYTIGYWNANNYILFLLIAYCVQFSRSIIGKYKELFVSEKYWKTLSALMVAPMHRFTLLIGVLVSELALNSIPLIIILVIAWILYPIPLLYFILILLIFFSIFITFGAIGLMIGALSITHEEYIPYFNIVLRFALLFSCANYPKEIFPVIIQNIVILDPFYYLFDLLRLTWYLGINYEEAISRITPTHLIAVVLIPILTPIISIFLFNRLYKKYGITGY